MAKPKRKTTGKGAKASSLRSKSISPRIIGGTFRGRKLQYAGDRRVRPMKDRVREAIFNLVGPQVKGKHVLDLFAGTGAIGLEAISRGAADATFIECHYPTAAVLRSNIATLEVESISQVVVADTFAWLRQEPTLSETSWTAFVSPPYEFFISRTQDMVELIGTLFERAPAESIVVVESDQRFDFSHLADLGEWDVRNYPPARVGIARIPQPQNPQIPNP